MRSFGEAKDRSPGLSAFGAGPAGRDASGVAGYRSSDDRSVRFPHAASPAGEPLNLIVAWMDAQVRLHGEEWISGYVERLMAIDHEGENLCAELSPAPTLSQRFAAALFVDFSEQHGLTPDELAALMANAGLAVGEALKYLVRLASSSGATSPQTPVREDDVRDGWHTPVRVAGFRDADAELDDQIRAFRDHVHR